MTTPCTSKYCPWDHDPNRCDECQERGDLVTNWYNLEHDHIGADIVEVDILDQRLAESDNQLEQGPTEYQLRQADYNESAARVELYLAKNSKMTPEQRAAREAQLLKELGF